MTEPESRAGPAEGPVPEEPLGLWEGYGVEIEFMIVDADTLDVRPVADRLFETVRRPDDSGRPRDDVLGDVEVAGVGWSNELALHVLELKTLGPEPRLDGLASRFQESLAHAEEALGSMECVLLPGGVHPWMDPVRDFRIWPHEYTDVYHAFDRIFSCRGHGWANLQSTHVNLPFRGDEEFALLHEAVRIVLPLIPALSASSPILDGRVVGALDGRLLAYRDNARRVPSVTGAVVPERIGSREEYRRAVLDRIYHDMAPLDPEGVLRHEWVNARGAIARFDRSSIEIRVIDAQEGPVADLAVVTAVVAAVRRVAAVLESDPTLHGRCETGRLAGLLDATARVGRRARPEGCDYRAYLALPHAVKDVGEIWAAFVEDGELLDPGSEGADALRTILDRGTLSERILESLGLRATDAGAEPGAAALHETYSLLASTLRDAGIFGR